MSKLRLPIRELLDQTDDAPATRRVWAGVQDRLHRPRRRWMVPVLAIGTASLIALFVRTRFTSHDGPLRLAGGEVPARFATTERSQSVMLNDGSSFTLDPTTAVETTGNDGRQFKLVLHRGHVLFDVAPGRHWAIDAGQLSVDVDAARFAVWRSEAAVEVEVFAGKVQLRGDAERTLDAPHSLRVTSPPILPRTPNVIAPTTPTVKPSITPKTAESRPRKSVPVPAAPEPTWRTLADEKHYEEAYQTLGSDGVKTESKRAATLDDLFRLSDIARHSGHPADAVTVLVKAVHDFPGDRRAAIAALTRARIHADDLHQPHQAAEAFAEALSLGLPQALTETARYRLVESRLADGDRVGARAAATDYHTRYPDGRYREAVDNLLHDERSTK